MATAAISIQSITYPQTYPLRHAVLWPEKPLDYVHVDDDPLGLHFGAFDGPILVAVISLFVRDGVGRFRKFATRPDYQRQGIGTQLLNRVILEAGRLGATTLWCDARQETVDFYRTFDLQPEGDVFYKGSIPYTKMSRLLM